MLYCIYAIIPFDLIILHLLNRFLLEDGKLNLCLRNLAEYKTYQHMTYREACSRDSTMVCAFY